jgi:thermitase
LSRKRITSCALGFIISLSVLMVSIIGTVSDTPPAGHVADISSYHSCGKQTGSAIIGQDSLRWDLLKIQAPDAWQIASGGSGVLVAVVDTGIDPNQKYLIGKVIDRISFASSSEINTIQGHGTHIAGLIAASLDTADIAGVAQNCSLLDVKVAENDGSTDAQKVAQGIIWAVNNGAQVINVSIVINKPYPLLEFATQYAWEKGCIILAAAGNTGSSEPLYPAAYPNVIAVAATERDDSLAGWSNRGECVDVAAPGVDIYSTLPDNCFGTKSGSSYSTGLVSGEAALLYASAIDLNNNNQINDEVSNTILNNSDNLVSQSIPGKRINVYKAVMSSIVISETLKNNVAASYYGY